MTETQATTSLSAQLQSFQQDPHQLALFNELKSILQHDNRMEELAELCETRARVTSVVSESIQLWFEAALIQKKLGDQNKLLRDFYAALQLDPAHREIAAMYFEQLRSDERYAEAANVTGREIEILEQQFADGNVNVRERLANRHRISAALWQANLGRLDRALHSWQRVFELEPHDTDALVQSRTIYSSLGDQQRVISLYETELLLPEIQRDESRRAAIELALGQLKRKRSEHHTAAQHLQMALTLCPSSRQAKEALAEVLATLPGDTNPKRSALLFVELGNEQINNNDQSAAISYFRRALGVVPDAHDAYDKLANSLAQFGRWQELDRLYQQQLSLATSTEDLRLFLIFRLNLFDSHIHDRDTLKSILAQLSENHLPTSEHNIRLRVCYEEDGDWNELIQLLETNVATLPAASPEVVPMLLELAKAHYKKPGNKNQAAEILHRILSIEPLNTAALSLYMEYFQDRRDWRGLTALQEFAIDHLLVAGASTNDLLPRMEIVADLCETRLGDIDRAISTWQRIQQLGGTTPKSTKALRRLLAQAKMWESLIDVLEQEAQQATTHEARAEALRRTAQVYRERNVNPRRAIAIYEEILAYVPSDRAALKSLGELYEREVDETGLAHTLRRQLELDSQHRDEGTDTTQNWSGAKRVERLTALRRLGDLYENQLTNVEGVVYACTRILELIPGDRETLERMSRMLGKAGDTTGLEQTLEQHVASATTPVVRSALLSRLARLAEARNDTVAATKRWEQVLKIDPDDADALQQLAKLYEKQQNFYGLAEVLDRSVVNTELPSSGSEEAAKTTVHLKHFAQVLETNLPNSPRSSRLWQRILKISQWDRDALNALCRLYEEAEQWQNLCDTLEKQIALHTFEDPNRAAVFALRRAELLEERIGSVEIAIQALEQLIHHIDPRNIQAHRKLKRLYETRGHFESAIRTAEREIVLTEGDTSAKIINSLEIGTLCRDRLHDPVRALQSFERVLQMAPEHDEALRSASDLYASTGQWSMHVHLLKTRAMRINEPENQSALMLQIAAVTTEKLSDHNEGFHWYQKAYESSPDATTAGELRRAAKTYGLWRELSDVYESDRQKLRQNNHTTSPDRFVAISKDIAKISCSHLQDPKRAIDALYDALEVEPHNESLLEEAQHIADESQQPTIWRRLLSCMNLSLRGATGAQSVPLYLRRARLRETQTHDISGALSDLLVAFSWAPHHANIHQELYSFGDRNQHWTEILSFETALAERSANKSQRIEILRRKANAYEKRADDLVRAFRTHISAFILSPENKETIDHLWRLARQIGVYTEPQKFPQPEAQSAHIENNDNSRPPPLKPSTIPKYRAATASNYNDDVYKIEWSADNETKNPDRTIKSYLNENELTPHEYIQELDIIDITDHINLIEEPTMELRTDDLIESLGQTAKKIPSSAALPDERSAHLKPPPTPATHKRSSHQSNAGATPKTNQPGLQDKSNVTSRELPASPQRAYSSPWSELAFVYCRLPAIDHIAGLRWRYLAAEVWENGANNIDRALDILSSALRALPTHAETHDRLFHLASNHDRWDSLATLYHQAAETASSVQGASELLIRAATIRTKQGQTHETESLFRRILGIQPENLNVRLQLENLYRSEERWIDLAAQLEERTDPRLGTAAPIGQRPALLRELTDLYKNRLSRKHDAIETLERLQELEPENLDLLIEIASLHESNQKWSKVVQTLTQLSELTHDQDIAREALFRIADIYQQKLELPERAIATYTRLLRAYPRDDLAFRKLDSLYQSFQRWDDLNALLKQRATAINNPKDSAKLLHRRALVMLEELNTPDEATSVLRNARSLDTTNEEIADALVLALVQARREREAAVLLEDRISYLQARGAAPDDIASMVVRLGTLQWKQLGDPARARDTFKEALALAADHPAALAGLSALTRAEFNPTKHAKMRMGEANALADSDAKIDALYDAGMSFRTAGNHADASQAFGQILQLRPYHSAATWAQSTLVDQGINTDADEAIHLLTAQLETTSLSPSERATVFTQLAALARQTGTETRAEQYLKEALQRYPQHVPAILGLADLLESSERWGQLEQFLKRVLPVLEQQPSTPTTQAHHAEILRRVAMSCEQSNRTDDAYETLINADRLHPDNLQIKLALGKNRYQAKRWREAALHLTALVDHPDAKSYPTDIAQGLCYAAYAEIQSLRPEKAPSLYKAALELKSDFAPALGALADRAIEDNDFERACDLLVRQAATVEDPAVRLSLLESVGDMLYKKLHSATRAQPMYEAARSAASPLDSSHMPLLSKLLACQRETRDLVGADQTQELLSSFSTDLEAP